MHFDEMYFEGEERDGFYITSLMKKAWAAQLEILQEIDRICERNNIAYFASCGTLLGAIRHGGYIPWDDDLDIEMKRLDYERFLKVAVEELPEGYHISSPALDHKWNVPFARVLNTMEIPLQGERLQQFHGFPMQAGVDIFPIDYLPVNNVEEEMMINLFRAAYMLALSWDKDEMSEQEKMESLREIETSCNVKFTQDKPYRQQLWMLADRISAMYWDTKAEAKEVSMIYLLENRPDFRIPVSCYEQAKRIPFENTTIPIPIEYERVLTVHYGEDYMTPKRGGADHEYPFYKKQQKMLEEYYKEKNLEIPKEFLE